MLRSRRIQRLIIVIVLLGLLSNLNPGLFELIAHAAQAAQGTPDEPVGVQPLTDMAGPQPTVQVGPEDDPEARRAQLGAAPDAPRVMPSEKDLEGMELAHPPQWTQTLAAPGAPQPPDLSVSPPLAIDPETGLAVEQPSKP